MMIALLDCVVDCILAPQIYKEDDFDKFYVIKSLLSVVTQFCARAVYLLVVDPIIYLKAKQGVDDMVENDGIIPNSNILANYSTQCQGFMHIILDKYIKQGMVMSNEADVKEELKYSKTKLEDSYPTKFMDMLKEIFDVEMAEKRKNAAEEIESGNRIYSYIENRFYQRCKSEFDKGMALHGMLSAVDVIKLDDIQCVALLKQKEIDNRENVMKYYAISILNDLAKDGVVEKCDFSDEMLDNHQYRHINGLPMKSINADENPALALDDD
jgi:hypothetical protein